MKQEYLGTSGDSKHIAIFVQPLGFCSATQTDSSEALSQEITSRLQKGNILYVARYDNINEKGLRKVLERFHNLDEIRRNQGISFLDLLHILN